MQLEGKAALVTGAGRGLGRSIALAYAQEGADVAIISRTPTELEQVAEEIRALGRRGLAITADLTDSQQTHRAVQEAIDGLGRLDILVNNAGGYRLFTDDLAHAVPFLDLSEEVWDVGPGDVLKPDHCLSMLQSGPAPYGGTGQRGDNQHEFRNRS